MSIVAGGQGEEAHSGIRHWEAYSDIRHCGIHATGP